MAKRKPDTCKDVYLTLVRRFPLRPIRSDEQLDRAVAVIDSLLDRGGLRLAEQDYLHVLSGLVEAYETEHEPEPTVSDAAMLGHLLEAKGVSQAEVARPTGIAQSTLSGVLSARRTLNRSHIGKLASYFNVGPGVFAFEP
jgi:HTH-type transcriptional regulator / antitoxin HigA